MNPSNTFVKQLKSSEYIKILRGECSSRGRKCLNAPLNYLQYNAINTASSNLFANDKGSYRIIWVTF